MTVSKISHSLPWVDSFTNGNGDYLYLFPEPLLTSNFVRGLDYDCVEPGPVILTPWPYSAYQLNAASLLNQEWLFLFDR